MKNSLITLLAVLFLTGVANAQEDGLKLAKSAGRALTTYNMDPANSAGKLDEAIDKINQAIEKPEAQALGSTWITRGDIYNTRLQRDMNRRMIDPKSPLTGDNDALVAFEAYQKGFEVTDKKFEKKDALKGISQVQGQLINIGAMKYDAGDYSKSFDSWKAALSSHKILKDNGEPSVLDAPEQLEEQTYYTAVCAMMAKRNQEAAAIYEGMIKNGTNRAAVYEGLYAVKNELNDKAGAEAVLAEGRKRFPDDPGLLFSEINLYLTKGKLTELTDRLKQAIAQEPNNVSLYVTLGSVYDNLYQRALNDKKDAEANANFEEAKKYYDKAVQVDKKSMDAYYAMGTLYYNKAALLTQEMNAMAEDFTPAGIKKYDAKKKEILDLFEKALPYFQNAEALDANDVNTLIALKEIYARKEDPLYTEFKTRLDNAQSPNNKNKGSHFKM